MQRYTLMISVRDKARADIAVSADRIYYRFATADTVDEGDIRRTGEQFGFTCSPPGRRYAPVGRRIADRPTMIFRQVVCR